MRLIDRLLYTPVKPPKWSEWAGEKWPREEQERIDKRIALIADTQAIVADNVNAYFSQYYIKGETNWQEDFPLLTPPFEDYFMEYRRAPFEIVDGKQRSTDAYPECIGWHFLAQREDNKWWSVDAMSFWEESKGDIICAGNVLYDVDHEGKIWNVKAKAHLSEKAKATLKTESGDDYTFLAAALMPTCLATTFMHCKNVELVDNTPHAKLSRHHERKSGHALVRYHTLNIHPMQKVLHSEGNIEHTGLKKALHICRGHFKTFEDRPLFGRVTGTFWWGAQVRGNAQAGVVDKDYVVHGREMRAG